MRTPELPEREEIEAGAETRLRHGELSAALPGFRKATPFQEHCPRFGEPVLRGKIDIAVPARVRRAVVRPVQFRMQKQAGHCAELTRPGCLE